MSVYINEGLFYVRPATYTRARNQVQTTVILGSLLRVRCVMSRTDGSCGTTGAPRTVRASTQLLDAVPLLSHRHIHLAVAAYLQAMPCPVLT
eukprot:2667181-Rhodomonas_salina.1